VGHRRRKVQAGKRRGWKGLRGEGDACWDTTAFLCKKLCATHLSSAACVLPACRCCAC
jgi:hypothetical protein